MFSTGPDLTSCSSESLSQTSPTLDLCRGASSWPADEEAGGPSDEAGGPSDEPLVQSDEEDVQPDVALVGLRDGGAVGGSDDSDSSADT